MALFPTIPQPVSALAQAPALSAARVEKRPTVLIRFDTPDGPDFGVDPAGRVMLATPQQAWIQAGLVACLTERAAYPVFPRWFGWPIERAMMRLTRGQQEADIRRGIIYSWVRCTGGRTATVDRFRFAWGAGPDIDQVEVHFRPVPIPGLGLRPPTLGIIL